MNKIDVKQIIIDAYHENSMSDEESKIIDEIVSLEDVLFPTLTEKQKELYKNIDFLKDGLDVLYEVQIVEYVLGFIKSILS